MRRDTCVLLKKKRLRELATIFEEPEDNFR